MASSIHHFTHKAHPLTVFCENSEYLCHGCGTLGLGKRYRCDQCDFNLHYCCAEHTEFDIIRSPHLHADTHDLKLQFFPNTQGGTRDSDCKCEVCGEEINGLTYRCDPCGFYIHPLCSKLPPTIRHAGHPDHELRLFPSLPGKCAACKNQCELWRYICPPCDLDLHPECVRVPGPVLDFLEQLPDAEQTLRSPPPRMDGTGTSALQLSLGMCYGLVPLCFGHVAHHHAQATAAPPPCLYPPPHLGHQQAHAAMAMPYYGGNLVHQSGSAYLNNSAGPQPPYHGQVWGPQGGVGAGVGGGGSGSGSGAGGGGTQQGVWVRRKMYKLLGQLALNLAIAGATGIPLPISCWDS